MPPFWLKRGDAMRAIDTNVVVRYLTGDHPEQSARARALIDGGPVFLPVTVVREVEWVLRSAYGFPAAQVARALRAFGGLATVTMAEGQAVARALDLGAAGLDFADALHLCLSDRCTDFATFDRNLVKSAQAAGQTAVVEA